MLLRYELVMIAKRDTQVNILSTGFPFPVTFPLEYNLRAPLGELLSLCNDVTTIKVV
jgi:hypothetical protein